MSDISAPPWTHNADRDCALARVKWSWSDKVGKFSAEEKIQAFVQLRLYLWALQSFVPFDFSFRNCSLYTYSSLHLWCDLCSREDPGGPPSLRAKGQRSLWTLPIDLSLSDQQKIAHCALRAWGGDPLSSPCPHHLGLLLDKVDPEAVRIATQLLLLEDPSRARP